MSCSRAALPPDHAARSALRSRLERPEKALALEAQAVVEHRGEGHGGALDLRRENPHQRQRSEHADRREQIEARAVPHQLPPHAGGPERGEEDRDGQHVEKAVDDDGGQRQADPVFHPPPGVPGAAEIAELEGQHEVEREAERKRPHQRARGRLLIDPDEAAPAADAQTVPEHQRGHGAEKEQHRHARSTSVSRGSRSAASYSAGVPKEICTSVGKLRMLRPSRAMTS